MRTHKVTPPILVILAVTLLGPRVAAGLSFGAPQDAAPPLAQLSTPPLFDSGEHPNTAVSVLGSLSRALFLSEERIVLLDGTTLLFINPRTGELWIAGGEGGGPGEFVVDGGPPIGGGGSDLGRPPGYVVEASPQGDLRTIVEYRGHETGDILFAHGTHLAIQDERIVVADTESEHIRIVDRSGTIVARIPMPGERVRVTDEVLETVRADAQARAVRSHERGLELYAELGLSTRGIEFRERDYRHNEVAPPIEAVRLDRDGRLWVRHYVLPADEVERWTVYDGEREAFALELPMGETWMDARGNHILLRIRNTLGVDRVVIREMVLPSGG